MNEWLRVTAIPSKGHLDQPRATFLIKVENVEAISQQPDQPVQIQLMGGTGAVTVAVSESLENIAGQLGLKTLEPKPQGCCALHAYQQSVQAGADQATVNQVWASGGRPGGFAT